MKTLEIDIETFSSINLSKSGVYRYVESLDFEILLFAYSIDGGDVKVIDLAMGEKIPIEILDALTDPNIIKWAFNANFERICLSRYLGYPTGKYLDPSSWRCSMIWSAYMGLPLSLEGVGTVLGLEKQKLKEGKDLIRYFCTPCKPTKTNGKRTRNHPYHDLEKWSAFKEYNKRDVETELEIQMKLSKFPVPEHIWHEYHLDQEINDRGVLLDLDFIKNAIEIGDHSRTKLIDEMKALTNLENPNSVQQLKGWLSENGLETESLGKKIVSELLEAATGDLSKVLTLRQQISKSSIKKYQTMENAVGSDNRARGMFQFYGANRTGRFAGRILQPQNLPRNNIPDLYEARELVHTNNITALDMLYDSIPEVLSQLIRTSFIPKANHKFIVADFSSIERVVLAWLAGEKWVLDAYERKEDLYIATASQMFDVPIEKIDKKSPLRDKGKVADLACIAEGQLVLTDKGLVPIERVTLAHKVWDGYSFVNHDGVIYKGVKEVITYEGLTATKDHLVWIEGQTQPIQFEYAATSGSHLIQTGNGRTPIRLGENYKPRKEMEQEYESLQSPNPVCKLRANTMDIIKQSSKRHFQRMSKMLSTKTNSTVVRQKINCSKTKMRKPKRFCLQKLWPKRNQIQLPFRFRGWSLDNGKFRSSRQKLRARQNKQQWALRTRKYQVCNKARKLCKQKKYSISKLESNRMALCKNCSYKKTISRNDKGRNYRGCKNSCITQKKELAGNRRKARLYDILNAGPNNRFTVSNVLVHNCGYGGSVGALISMGALDMGLEEYELKPLVDSWRLANSNIVNFWWDVDRVVLKTVRERTTTTTHGIEFSYKSGMLFITLPSGRQLSYVKPKIGVSKFGSDCVTYEGLGGTKKWERIQSYGPKFVENIVQAISRDILIFSMEKLRHFSIVMHIHDEIIIEAEKHITVDEICKIMCETPPWSKGLQLRAEGFEGNFYKKD
jgi:DNA polymerase